MANSGRVARSATEALKLLWEAGFFRTWKRSKGVEEQLNKRGYNFSSPELGMALKRAKHLTRRGRQGSFEYIQKYPFFEEAGVHEEGKKTNGKRRGVR